MPPRSHQPGQSRRAPPAQESRFPFPERWLLFGWWMARLLRHAQLSVPVFHALFPVQSQLIRSFRGQSAPNSTDMRSMQSLLFSFSTLLIFSYKNVLPDPSSNIPDSLRQFAFTD